MFFADKKILYIHTSTYRGIKIARGCSGGRTQTALEMLPNNHFWFGAKIVGKNKYIYRSYTPQVGWHLCVYSNKMSYVTLNKLCINRAHFLYFISSRFLFGVESDSSSWADQFSKDSFTSIITNKWFFLLLFAASPPISPPFLVHFYRFVTLFQHQIY